MKLVFKIILLCWPLYSTPCKSQNSISREKVKHVDSFLENEIRKGFSGSILLSENGTILLAKGYGLADREHKIGNNESTVFEIASITKLFTAVAILQLAEDGKISLDDRISNYLGDFPSPKDKATIYHLLLHTAGLIPRGYELDYDTKSNFIESVKRAPSESIPGATYRYTNAGYVLLAAIIEEVSQLSYEDYLIKNIFKPLNLVNTTFGSRNFASNIANGYSGRSIDSLKIYRTSEFVWGDYGPSGILTNVHDLHTFLQCLDSGKLLTNEYMQKMYVEQEKGEAIGFHVLNKPDIGKILARGGGLPHFESQVAWYKEKDIKVIILINNHLGTRQPVWDGIEKIIFESKN